MSCGNCFSRAGVFILWWCALSVATAGGTPGFIVSFDDSEIEVIRDGDFDDLPVDDFPVPPLEVLGKDGRGFLKVKTKSGEDVWVSPSYVTTDTLKNMKKNCQTRKIARQGDKRQYGVRGVGEECQ